MDKDIKNSISHRGKSLQALKEHFSQLNDGPSENKKAKLENN